MLSILSNDLWLVSIYSRYKSAQRVLSGSHFFLLYLNYYNTYAHKESREFYDPSCKFESIDWKKRRKKKKRRKTQRWETGRDSFETVIEGQSVQQQTDRWAGYCAAESWELHTGRYCSPLTILLNGAKSRLYIQQTVRKTQKLANTLTDFDWLSFSFFFFFRVKGAYRAADVNCKRASVFHCVVCAGWLPLFFSFDRPLSKSCWAADLCPEKRRGFETSYGQTKEPREFSGRSV